MESNNITLIDVYAGSRLYKLDTPDSDFDRRYIYVTTDSSEILGLNRHEFEDGRLEGVKDDYGEELRRFLKYLRKGNTNSIELLFVDESETLSLSPFFKERLFVGREKLIPADKLYHVLRGYGHGELKLALGERTGRLGGKRQAQVATYGFSPKNFVQLLRLYRTGRVYYETGVYPLVLNDVFRQTLLNIKTQPENWKKENLVDLARQEEADMTTAFSQWEKTKPFNHFFDEEYAEELVAEVYFPILCTKFLKNSLILKRSNENS